jgi:AraC family transcriptional regulator, arabinose operon regulatory protein
MRITPGTEDIFTFPQPHSNNFRLELIGRSFCDGDYYIQRKNTSTWVFEYIEEGEGTLTVNHQTFHPKKGNVYIIPAYSEHTYFSDANNPWVKTWFNVSGPLIPTLISNYGIHKVILAEDARLKNIFDNAYVDCQKDTMNAHHKASLAIHEIIAIIAQKNSQLEVKKTQKLHNFLSTHIHTPATTEQMTHLTQLSISQTIRLFKKEWNMTPYQLQMKCRMNAAETLLNSTSKTIREISSTLGFSDEYHFANIFKKKVGISPGKFRN